MYDRLMLIVPLLPLLSARDTITPCYIPLTELALTEDVETVTSAATDLTSNGAVHHASSIGTDTTGDPRNQKAAPAEAVIFSESSVTRTTDPSVIAEAGEGCFKNTATLEAVVANEGSGCGVATTSYTEAQACDEPCGGSATTMDTSTSCEKVNTDCGTVEEDLTSATSSGKHERIHASTSTSPTATEYAILCIPYCAAMDQDERCVSIKGCALLMQGGCC